MFDFFYVNKIETNLAVQSNSLHVKQKIAPLRRKEPKLYSDPLPSTLPPAIFGNHCISANECPIQSPWERVTAGEELTPTATLSKMFSDQDKGYGIYAESQCYCQLSP